MPLNRTLLVCLMTAVSIGLPIDGQHVAMHRLCAGERLTKVLHSLPHFGRATSQSTADKPPSSDLQKPWTSVSKWRPHWPFGSSASSVTEPLPKSRPASDAWQQRPIVASSVPPTSVKRSQSARPATRSLSQTTPQPHVKRTTRTESPDPAPQPPAPMTAEDLAHQSKKPTKRTTAVTPAAKTPAKGTAQMARCGACGPPSSIPRVQNLAIFKSLGQARKSVPQTASPDVAANVPDAKSAIALQVSHPDAASLEQLRSTTAEASTPMAKADSQPSRAILAPMEKRSPAPRAKTPRDNLPTTLAKTHADATMKLVGVARETVSNAERTRPAYPRTVRQPTLPTASKLAPVVDVATYRESVTAPTSGVRNVSSTSSVMRTEKAPAGTWLATYQQLVRQETPPPAAQAPAQAPAVRTSRRCVDVIRR